MHHWLYTPDGRYAVDHEVRTSVFNADGSLLWEADGYDPAWSADGTLVALLTEADVSVVDAATGAIRYQRSFADAAAEVVPWDVTFAGDPALLFVETTARWYSDTVVWDLTADTITTMPEFLDMPDLNKMTLLAAAPDGVTMVFAQTGGDISYDILYVLNLETREILEVSGDYTLPYTDGTFSPDGSLFAMRNIYRDTHFWQVSAAGWEYQTGLATGGVASFSPDGRYIALEDYVYQLDTGAQIIDFDRVITRFTASPDGDRAFEATAASSTSSPAKQSRRWISAYRLPGCGTALTEADWRPGMMPMGSARFTCGMRTPAAFRWKLHALRRILRIR